MTEHRHRVPPSATSRTALACVVWRKSSYSGSQGNCVEVAAGLVDVVAVRDSKDSDGAALVFTRDTWTAFVGQVRRTGTDRV